jgi:hypothetical protein
MIYVFTMGVLIYPSVSTMWPRACSYLWICLRTYSLISTPVDIMHEVYVVASSHSMQARILAGAYTLHLLL